MKSVQSFLNEDVNMLAAKKRNILNKRNIIHTLPEAERYIRTTPLEGSSSQMVAKSYQDKTRFQ